MSFTAAYSFQSVLPVFKHTAGRVVGKNLIQTQCGKRVSQFKSFNIPVQIDPKGQGPPFHGVHILWAYKMVKILLQNGCSKEISVLQNGWISKPIIIISIMIIHQTSWTQLEIRMWALQNGSALLHFVEISSLSIGVLTSKTPKGQSPPFHGVHILWNIVQLQNGWWRSSKGSTKCVLTSKTPKGQSPPFHGVHILWNIVQLQNGWWRSSKGSTSHTPPHPPALQNARVCHMKIPFCSGQIWENEGLRCHEHLCTVMGCHGPVNPSQLNASHSFFASTAGWRPLLRTAGWQTT